MGKLSDNLAKQIREALQQDWENGVMGKRGQAGICNLEDKRGQALLRQSAYAKALLR